MIFTTESIDGFIVNGVADAAESVGILAPDEFVDETLGPEERFQAVPSLMEEGHPLAYLVVLVGEALKNGLRNNGMLAYAGNQRRNSTMDLVHVAENTWRELSEQGGIGPARSLQEVADLILLSMTIEPSLEKLFSGRYDDRELEYRAGAYYGQASLDRKKAGYGDGLAVALGHMADGFGDYLVVMGVFARMEMSDQSGAWRLGAKVEEVRRRNHAALFDDYLRELGELRRLRAEKSDDIGAADDVINGLNRKGRVISRLDSDFQYSPIPLMDN